MRTIKIGRADVKVGRRGRKSRQRKIPRTQGTDGDTKLAVFDGEIDSSEYLFVRERLLK
jgi:hypothetical protein